MQGDPASYSYGRTNNRDIIILDQTGGNRSQPGAQGFPGWSPAEAVDESRNNTALYLDVEKQLHEKFLIGGAIAVGTLFRFRKYFHRKIFRTSEFRSRVLPSRHYFEWFSRTWSSTNILQPAFDEPQC